MRLTRRLKIQLFVFAIVSTIAGLVMAFGYMGLPSLLFGIGRYTVTIQLPSTGGLYKSGQVTYRGLEVGRVADVRMTNTGIEADLSLDSNSKIPASVDARVHSRSAVGEQFVDLIPRADAGTTALKDGDVIPLARTSVPPDIGTLLDDTNRGLEAIPRENLKTVVDEGDAALTGLGPDLRRLIKGSTALAIDARANLEPLTNLIDQAKPVLDTQSETSGSIQAWAAHLAAISSQVNQKDAAVRGILQNGPGVVDEGRQLFERLQPTLPILMANLVSIADVAVTYHPGIEQLLVLVPQAVGILDSLLVPNLHNPTAYRGAFVTFGLNINVPPPCQTGYLPASQQRPPTDVDYPERHAGDLYCRVPQDSPFNVRGARNLPCVGKSGKRAPTAKMCESDEQYVPLNDGYNWKGDPNATLSGQGVPQLRPGEVPPPPHTTPPDATTPAAPVPPPIAVAQYDPATGNYIGPDGMPHTQSNLARDRPAQTWQSMLLPPER
ncbi:MlaD family protein [Mycobacterium sp. 050128]|uniref:MlaD family protein n=1 Tax=Mycobacterium sp. 050128 TaxID=3096112 RepID=UPI002EDB69CF